MEVLMEPIHIHKIIWAVDPYSKIDGAQRQTVRVIKALARATNADVEPVSVVKKDRFEALAAIYGNDSFPEEIQKEWNQRIHGCHFPGERELRFLKSSVATSTRAAVEELLEYARESGAELIALSTHARQGMARLFMGSFSETLLLHSPIPVLICNPKAKEFYEIKNIFFPTDFSEASKVAFSHALRLARCLGTKVFLYHKVEYPLSEDRLLSVPEVVSNEWMESVEHEYNLLGQSWIQQGQAEGVDTRFHLSRGAGPVAADVVRAAKAFQRTGLVVMGSHATALGAALLGSTTTQVVRQCVCPVLVYHVGEEAIREASQYTFRPEFQELGATG
jgi:nucleotide-binding universal stress UspA family protein